MTDIFTLAEILYLYPLCYILVTNRDQFGPDAQPVITRVFYNLAFIAFVGATIIKPELCPVVSVYSEWLSFFSDFIIRF